MRKLMGSLRQLWALCVAWLIVRAALWVAKSCMWLFVQMYRRPVTKVAELVSREVQRQTHANLRYWLSTHRIGHCAVCLATGTLRAHGSGQYFCDAHLPPLEIVKA